MNSELRAAWNNYDSDAFRKLAQQYGVKRTYDETMGTANHEELLMPLDQYRRYTKLLCILMDLAEQDEEAEPLDIMRVAESCSMFGELYDAGDTLMRMADKTYMKAHLRWRRYREHCRASVLAVLGCCGKQRRALGGQLRDASGIVARKMWKTRYSAVWRRPDDERFQSEYDWSGMNH